MKAFIFFTLLLFSFSLLNLQAQEVYKPRNQDNIKIIFSGIPDEDAKQLNNIYTIDESGTISLVFIDRIKVVGMSTSDIAKKIREAFITKGIFTHPNVVVSIDDISAAGGTSRIIGVGGEVKASHPVAYYAGITLVDAINSCGGFSDFGHQDKVKLMRKDETGKVVTSVHNLKHFTEHPEENVALQPGDRIQVP